MTRERALQSYFLRDTFTCCLIFRVFSNIVVAGNYWTYSLSHYLHLLQGCAVTKMCVQVFKMSKPNPQTVPKQVPDLCPPFCGTSQGSMMLLSGAPTSQEHPAGLAVVRASRGQLPHSFGRPCESCTSLLERVRVDHVTLAFHVCEKITGDQRWQPCQVPEAVCVEQVSGMRGHCNAGCRGRAINSWTCIRALVGRLGKLEISLTSCYLTEMSSTQEAFTWF